VSAKDDFNQILKDRAEWEKNLGTPTAAQWADWTMNILARSDLSRLAVASGAAALLALAGNKLREQRLDETRSDHASESWRPDVYAWLTPPRAPAQAAPAVACADESA